MKEHVHGSCNSSVISVDLNILYHSGGDFETKQQLVDQRTNA